MNTYLILRSLHAGLAIASGIYFAARGIWRIGLQRPIRHRLWKTLPHLIDALLLATGMTLAVWLGLRPTVVPWFGMKLIGVVVYIGLGVMAFRSRSRPLAWSAYAAALLVWLWIIGMALGKQPLGWLA